MAWLGPANAWWMLYGVLVIWLGFVFGLGSRRLRLVYLRGRFR